MVILTGLATFLVWRTVIYTKGVLDEAKKATTAANRTVDETRQIGEAQSRAYITATDILIKEQSNGSANMFFDIINKGSSPAIEIGCAFEYEAIKKGAKPRPLNFKKILDEVPFGNGACSAGGSLTCAPLVISKKDIKGWQENKTDLIVRKIFVYKDVFEKKNILEECVYLLLEDGHTEKSNSLQERGYDFHNSHKFGIELKSDNSPPH